MGKFIFFHYISLLFICNIKTTTSGKNGVDEKKIEINFIMDIVKQGILGKFDRISIVYSFKTDTMIHQHLAILDFRLIAKSMHTSSFINNLSVLEHNNRTELVWFPLGITHIHMSSLQTLMSKHVLNNKYFLFALNEIEKDEVIYNLPKRFDDKLFYYENIENWDINSSSLALREVYRVGEGMDGLKINVLAKFTSIRKLKLIDTMKSMWHRRNNLNGKVFKALFDRHKMGVVKVTNHTYNNRIIYHPHGMIYDIMEILSNRLNFTVIYSPAKKNCSWSHIVKSVSNGQYDFTNNIMQLTFHRSKIVDLSFEIIESSLRLYYPRKVNEIKWLVYLKSFQPDAWVFVVFHFIGTGLSLYVMTRLLTFLTQKRIKTKYLSNKYCKEYKNKKEQPTVSRLKLLKKSINFSLRSIVGKRHKDEPESIPIQIIFLSATFAGFVLITAYRSMLAASIAIEVHYPPVHSLEDVYRLSKHLIIWKGTEMERVFTQARQGSIEYKIKNAGLLRPEKLSDAGLMKDFIQGYIPNTILLTYKKHAMKMNPFQDQEKPYPCKIKDVGKDYGKISAGTIYPKNWPYTKLFNHNLLKLQEEGILDIIRNKYIPRKVQKCGNHGRNLSQSNIYETLSAFIFLAIAQGFTFVVFLLEWLYKRQC